MKRLWELATSARGWDRVYCIPFMVLFRAITPLYQAISRRHLARRRKRCSRDWTAPVISVGGVTVGGSGKTPIVISLARRLIDSGKKVVVVHSGYGRAGRSEQLIPYGRGSDSPVDLVGDEVAMMARMVPSLGFAVGRDKKGLVIRADRELSPDTIIIDDGYQRLDIQKESDLAVVDRELLGERPRLFPGGVLSERLSALSRANAIFLFQAADSNLPSDMQSTIRKYNPGAPIVAWIGSLDGVEIEGRSVGLDQLYHRKPFLFAGIGSYPRLLAMVSRAGIPTAAQYSFGDHFDYHPSDLALLRDMAHQAGADCYLTTAKDRIKLADGTLDLPLYCLILKVTPSDGALVDTLIGIG